MLNNDLSQHVGFEVSVVAFDLDGTLADTLPDLHTATNLTLNDLGHDPVSTDVVRQYIGQGIEYLLVELFKDLKIYWEEAKLKSIAHRFREHYARHVCEHSVLFPGIETVLNTLQNRGLKMACLTNKSELFTAPILMKLGIRDYFQEVVCGDTLEKRKPDALPLRVLASRFSVDIKQILMVGDSKTDTACARNAGAPVVCVPFGYRSGMALAELDCDAVLGRAEDLLDLVRLA
ncbi:MAG: phosphoglycolate phosphatase [Burkholderiales bacterium]|nr:phosphoglycolate phosphatase [Burkholderiales bacterium]OUT80062.1 MAG: phosphoglycolate phosphatase [Betaproteobacteria bacterium TMED22]|tara:strand:- start:380 stop:1078 length:699 start_codon:yes stop_codon:yes gene_type:complete